MKPIYLFRINDFITHCGFNFIVVAHADPLISIRHFELWSNSVCLGFRIPASYLSVDKNGYKDNPFDVHCCHRLRMPMVELGRSTVSPSWTVNTIRCNSIFVFSFWCVFVCTQTHTHSKKENKMPKIDLLSNVLISWATTMPSSPFVVSSFVSFIIYRFGFEYTQTNLQQSTRDSFC